MTRAVDFAYHNVGCRCLSVLLAHGVDIPLVLTHEDSPTETIWFDSVAALAAEHDIPVLKTLDPNAPEIVARIADLAPDFLFSFYYRLMLKSELLALPRLGALNMHGSLLPKYRGRVPVNWAIIRGERQTGATLHYMTAKPDAGAIVGAQAVPILPEDSALTVFHKVTWAAELTLDRALPALMAGTATPRAQHLEQGSYFGGRRAEDGKIDWTKDAWSIHNLVRAVAPPYPGAFTTLQGQTLRLLRTRVEPDLRAPEPGAHLFCTGGRCYCSCGDGGVLRVFECTLGGRVMTPADFVARFGEARCPLGI